MLDNPNHKWIICDLDGTICNIDHRVHLAKERRWDDFNALLSMDEPNYVVVDILRAMEVWDGVFICLCTARNERWRAETEAWLHQHDIPYDVLLMRKDGDERSDYIVKGEMVPAGTNVSFVIEDRDRVVKMWRERGYTVLQPADGGY